MQISKIKHKNTVILFAIVLFGAVLRIYNLDFQSLWNDELSTICRSNYENILQIFNNWDDVHPPGQHILMFFWIKLFGTSVFAIRLLSAIAGIFSIIAIYFLAKKIYSKNEAIISSAFMAIIWCPVYYSQEARQYSVVILFSILSSYFLIEIIELFKNNQKLKLKTTVFYILSAIVLSYYHYFGLLLVAMQMIYLLLIFITDFKKLLKIFSIFAVVFIAYLPWLSTLIFYTKMESLPFMKSPTLIDFVYYFEFLFNWSEPFSKLVLVFYVFLFAITIYKYSKTEKPKNYIDFITKPEIILGFWLFVPLIIVFIKSNISATIFSNRNLLISLPASYILLSRAITQIPLKMKWNFILATILILVFVADLIFRLDYYNKPTKEQFNEVSKYIIDNDLKFKNSYILACVNNKQYVNYYFEKFSSNLRLEKTIDENSDSLDVKNILKNQKFQYLWFIQAHNVPQNSVLKYLENNFELIQSDNFIGGNVKLLKRTNI